MTDPGYRIARQITDEILGTGTYAEINRGNPDPRVQAEVQKSGEDMAKKQLENEMCSKSGPHSPHIWANGTKYCKGK